MYVSHVLEEIERLAHHMVLLENGRVVASGRLEELKTRLKTMH
jgi:molybdate transport system ATP-binding protein